MYLRFVSSSLSLSVQNLFFLANDLQPKSTFDADNKEKFSRSKYLHFKIGCSKFGNQFLFHELEWKSCE